MEALITALTTAVTPTVLVAQVTQLVPFLAIVIPFSLGIYFLRKMVKGVSKAKVKF